MANVRNDGRYNQHIRKSFGDYFDREVRPKYSTIKVFCELINSTGDYILSPQSLAAFIKGDREVPAALVLLIADLMETSTDEILGAYDDYQLH